MADSQIVIPSSATQGGSPASVDTRTQAGGDHRQVVVVGDGTATATQTVGAGGGGDALVSITNPNSVLGGLYATLGADGSLNVQMAGTTLFSDTFESAILDQVVKWSPSGNTAPIIGQGVLQVAPGQVTNASSVVSSRPVFAFSSAITLGTSLSFEAGTISLGNHRFFGFGTTNAQTSSAPLYDAIGWEVTTAGALQACIYSAGTETFSSSVAIPTDGAPHRYVIVSRGDVTWWYKDTFDLPVAVSFLGPTNQKLPIRLHSINGTITNAVSPVYTMGGIGCYDNARNNQQVSDGSNPWIKAAVKDAAKAAAASDPAMVVALSPNSPLPGLNINAGELLLQESNSALILTELRRIGQYLSLLTGETIANDDLREIQ